MRVRVRARTRARARERERWHLEGDAAVGCLEDLEGAPANVGLNLRVVEFLADEALERVDRVGVVPHHLCPKTSRPARVAFGFPIQARRIRCTKFGERGERGCTVLRGVRCRGRIGTYAVQSCITELARVGLLGETDVGPAHITVLVAECILSGAGEGINVANCMYECDESGENRSDCGKQNSDGDKARTESAEKRPH